MTPHERRVYAAVLRRDGGCVAPLIDPAERGACGPESIDLPRAFRKDVRYLEREHVRYAAAMGGERITEVSGVVILCQWHHRGSRAGRVWALAHKLDLRAYLERKTREAADAA